MPAQTESNACRTCAISKRKCGREMPSCARCADKGMACVYPLSRTRPAPSSRPLLLEVSSISVPTIEDRFLPVVADDASAPNPLLPDPLMLDLTFPSADSAPSTSLIQSLKPPSTRADWFLAPETWRIMVSPTVDSSATVAAGRATMSKYVAEVQSWFQRWVTTGSCPFIHARLYSVSFPACVQVAYATLASYVHRTPATKDAVLQIVEDRSIDLLQANGAIQDMSGTEGWTDGGEQDVDLFGQLARLHALMVYQIIGLFDGDIRSRYVAEGRIPVQNSWTFKLFRSAAKALSNTHSVATNLVGCLPKPSTYSQQQWYLWILSETIRRTWLVALGMSCVFSALQQRWSTCPGGVMYTNRKGLWTARSASEWEKQCLESDVGFMQRFECGSLFDNADPADIDEFGMAMMDLTFNAELVEKWRYGTGGL